MRRLWRIATVLTLVGAVTLSVVLGVSITARSAHQFSDIPNSPTNIHDAVDWLVNRAITLGCSAGLYCPNDFVTRAQMALFMQRLGTALTPVIITRTGGDTTPLDLDVTPTVCATTTDYTPTFPQTAIIHSRVSVVASVAELDYWAYGGFSTNAGTSWGNGGPAWSAESRAYFNGAHAPNFNIATVSLSPGTPYRFGVRLLRAFSPTSGGGGTGDIAKHWCSLHVEIVNRNGTSIPFGSQNRSQGSHR